MLIFISAWSYATANPSGTCWDST